MIVVLEGIDNCGKNTVAKRLISTHPYMRQIDFPDYETEFGQFIKKQLQMPTLSAISLQLLFSSERLSKADNLKLRTATEIIITTRYSYSALAYGTARGIDKKLLSIIETGMPKPDLKLFLKIDVEESMKRSTTSDLFESDALLLTKVALAYEEILYEDHDWYLIDAQKTINDVYNTVEKIILDNINNNGLKFGNA